MPETAGDYSTRDEGLGSLACASERPQRLFRHGERVLPWGADRCPARSRRDGSPRGLPYEGGGGGACRGAGNGEVVRTVCDRARADLPREELDPREAEQVPGRLGKRPEAVDELLGQVFHLGEGAEARSPAVQVYAFDLIHDVPRRQIRVERELYDNRPLLAPLLGLAPRCRDGFFQKGQVHLEADGRYVPRLLGAEQVSRAPDLQIPHGDGEPAPQLGKVHQRLEPLLRFDRRPQWSEQVGVGLFCGTSDPAPKLVQ